MVAVIYGLVDPRYNEVRYVGKTSQSLDARLWDHHRKATTRTPVGAWLLKLRELDLKPEIAVLEAEPADWREAERRWIAHYRELYPGKMKNLRDGGQGGFTAEMSGKTTSESSKKGWATKRANGWTPPSGSRKTWMPEQRKAQSERWLNRRLYS